MPFNQKGTTAPGLHFPRLLRYRSEVVLHLRAQDLWFPHDNQLKAFTTLTGDQGVYTRATAGRGSGRDGFVYQVTQGIPIIEAIIPDIRTASRATAERSRAGLLTLPQTVNKANDSEALGGWSVVGTPVVTDRNLPGVNATGELFNVADDAGGSEESITTPVNTLTGDTKKGFSFYVGQGAVTVAGGARFKVRDTGGAADRAEFAVTWGADGVPAVTFTTGEAFGPGIEKGPKVGGVQLWRVMGLTTAVTAANAHQIEVYPGGAAATGDVYCTGFQVEDGAFVSPYKETVTTATTTENAHALTFTLTNSNLLALIREYGATVMHTFQDMGAASVDGACLWYWGDDTEPDIMVQVASGKYQSQIEIGAGTHSSVPAAAPTVGNFVEHVTQLYPEGNIQALQADADQLDEADLSFATQDAGAKSASGTVLPDSMSSDTIYIGHSPAGEHAPIRTIAWKLALGVLTRDEMRKAF